MTAASHTVLKSAIGLPSSLCGRVRAWRLVMVAWSLAALLCAGAAQAQTSPAPPLAGQPSPQSSGEPSVSGKTQRTRGPAPKPLQSAASEAPRPSTVVFYPPFGLPGLHELVDGKAVGLYPELIEAISSAAGLRAELRSSPWPAPLDAVRTGDGDVLGPVMGSPSSFSDLVHTQPLMRVEWARFVRTGDARKSNGIAFTGERVAVLEDSYGTRWLAREHPAAIQVPVKDIAQGLQALVDRRADALLTLKLPTRQLLARSGEDRIEEVGTEITAPMTLALAPRSQAVLPSLNAAIEALTANGELERLRNKWMPAAPRTAAEIAEDRLLAVLAFMVVILLLLAGVLGLANRRLFRARRAAEEARQAKSEFLAVMSHEIRTPINGLVNLIDLLQRSAPTPEQAELLGKAEQANRSLLTLVNQVLDFSKIEASRMEIRPHPMEMAKLRERVQAVLSAQPKAKDVRLEFISDLPSDWPPLMADEQRLSQVMINLGGNALKFTQRGRVCVAILPLQPGRDEAGARRLRFEVVDTGPGIAADDLSRLFQPFVQLKTGLDRPHAGTGLGLSTSAELVRQMGGALQVESEPGVRTRFWFDLSLPEAPATEPPQADTRTSEAVQAPTPTATDGNEPRDTTGPSSANGARRVVVLVVDDNPLNLLVTRKILEQEGFEVRQAAEAHAALQQLQDPALGLPDLILMDLHMPGLDGVQAMRQMQATLGDRLPPVMAVSGAVTDEAQQAAMAAGMRGFLPKPFERQSLLAAIAALQKA